jgi:hypothetical protein
MPLVAGTGVIQKAYIGASEVNSILNSGVNLLNSGGIFPSIVNSNLYLPLKNTIVPTRGTSTPTFTQATAAWGFDNEGKLNLNIPSGCVRFTGARLVRNRVAATSATLAVAATNTVTLVRAETVTFSMGAGTGTATFSGTSGASGTLTASAGGRTEVTKTCTAGTFIITASVATLVDIQVEVVSGQADQTASEYVSVGVLSAPFHGAGVDGCKWLNTNKDGSAISAATLEGYNAEPSRVNNCFWGRQLRGMVENIAYTSYLWVNPQLGGSAELISNGTFTTDTAGWTAQAGATISVDTNRLKIVTPGGAFAGASTPIACTVGKTYTLTLDHITGDANLQFGVGSGASNLSLGYVVLSGTVSRTISFVATHATMYLFVYFSSGVTVGKYAFIDNVSVKEAAIQVTTTTGLDNIADSASRLTATADDATLLQLLTAATGSRTFSAWIKRISGSGTVSLTRNGGTGWTDITSSLVTDTWVPVSLTSDVGANPTVGLKMGTSGDVIEVDCCQDENGAWRTSPILTTTAAVTRNADVLSYASAFDVTQGTALCSVQSFVPITVSGYVVLAGDANARMLRFGNLTARDSGELWDATNTATATGVSLLTGNRKRASRWGPDLRMCADGNLGVSAVFDGSMGASTTMYVGCSQTGAAQISGNIGEVHIWNAPLTDAQMQQVTS